MIDLVRNRSREIAEICERFRVRRLDLFGSASARGHSTFDSGRSDVDFVVWFDEAGEMGPFDQFFGLLESLEQLLGRKVDLVDGAAISNPYFLQSVEQTCERVYGAGGKKAIA